MMLYELFSWLSNNEISLPFANASITQAMVCDAQALAQQKQKKLRGDVYYASHYTASLSTQNRKEAANCLEAHISYMNFLPFCLQQLQTPPPSSLYLLAFQYLIKTAPSVAISAMRNEKIAAVFSAIMAENKEMAMALYETHQEQLANLDAVKRMVLHAKIDWSKIDEALDTLNKYLIEQENPLAITCLFRNFIHEPEWFAASILWLLQQGAGAIAVLETRLLQDYFAYHMAYLNTDYSPIRLLYYMLEQYPVAQELVERSLSIACESRGFENYGLNGQLGAGLTQFAARPAPLAFTPTAINFRLLHQLFGADFFVAAWRWLSNSLDGTWADLLQEVLNNPGECQHLVALIQHVAMDNKPEDMALLASLVSDETALILLESHQGVVLHLLPYKAILREQVTVSDIQKFLDALYKQNSSSIELIPQFLSLLMSFQSANKAAAETIYSYLLDLLIQHPEWLGDRTLMKQMRKFVDRERIINEKCQILKTQLTNCITEQITAGEFTVDNYHRIEDTWRSMQARVQVLLEIGGVDSHCFANIYAMQVHIAKALFAKDAEAFEVDAFIAALGINRQLAEAGVNVYERLLIELLVEMDDHGIRQAIIERLRRNGEANQWMVNTYEDIPLIEKVISHGNWGLFCLMAPQMQLNAPQMISLAVDTQQWRMVNYFCDRARIELSPAFLQEVFNRAVEAGQLRTIKLICSINKPLCSKYVLQCFTLAASHGHLDVLTYLCSLNKKALNDTTIIHALKVAINAEKLGIVEFLANMTEKPMIAKAIDDALVAEMLHGRLTVIKTLCNLSNNAPSKGAMSKALVRAVKYNRQPIVDYLCTEFHNLIAPKTLDESLFVAAEEGYEAVFATVASIPYYIPSERIIDLTFLAAIKARQFECAKSIWDLFSNKPRSRALHEAMQMLAEFDEVGVIDYLYCRVKSTMESIKCDNALIAAAKVGNLATVGYLLNKSSQNGITQAWQIAAQKGHLAVVVYCCEHFPPQPRALKEALSKKAIKRNEEMACFLKSFSSQAPRKKNAHLRIQTAVVDECDSDSEMPVMVESLRSPNAVASPAAPMHRVTSLRNLERQTSPSASQYRFFNRRVDSERQMVFMPNNRPPDQNQMRRCHSSGELVDSHALSSTGLFTSCRSSERNSVSEKLKTSGAMRYSHYRI